MSAAHLRVMGSPPVKDFGQSSPELAAWAARVYHPEDPVLAEVRARSEAAGLPGIAVGPLDGLHLEVLARAAGARRAVEIGTLAGYSGLCLLRGMGPEGHLDTFEVEPRHAEVARRTFALAGVAGQVRLHLGPALDGLRALEREGPFDLVFIDADKGGYPAYLAWAEVHLRPGGLLLADNTFAFGHVHAPEAAGKDREAAEALARFSERLAGGGRFRATILPTGEWLSVGVKVARRRRLASPGRSAITPLPRQRARPPRCRTSGLRHSVSARSPATHPCGVPPCEPCAGRGWWGHD